MSRHYLIAALAISAAFASEYRIDNRTLSLKVVSITDDDSTRGLRFINVTLMNTSKKPIETLVVGMGTWTLMQNVNLFHGGMPPGTTFSFDVQPPRYAPGYSGAPEEDVFRVLAAIFDEKQADGDAESIHRAFDDRAGKKEQYVRLLGLIEAVEREKSGDARMTLNELVYRVAELPESTDGSAGKWVKAGALSSHRESR